MISLLNRNGGYSGHFCGTMNSLANNVGSYFPHNRKNISRNIGALRVKYNNKINGREHSHIFDEQEYLIKSSNAESGSSIMEDIIRSLNIKFEEPETVVEQEEPVMEDDFVSEIQAPEMSDMEKDITIGLLCEQLEQYKDYADKLLGLLEERKALDQGRIAELEAENAGYKRALVDIRNHTAENLCEEKKGENETAAGHALLGQRGKILVLGECSLDEKTLNGIAKTYGFERKDFVYETSYEKIKEFAGRISYGSRYSAIILSACPHKVNQLGDYSSLIDKCKNDDTLPDAYDARTLAGELKVTKESYRRVLEAIIRDLKAKQTA